MKTKKLLSFILSFTLIFQLFIVPASAATKTTANELDAAVADIMKLIDDKMSDFEKVTILYNWMRSNVSVGDLNAKNTAYGALVKRASMCNGFARGYQRLLDEAGIENMYIAGKSNWGNNGHAWNLVKLDGKWYHADTNNQGIFAYGTFLVSDKEFKSSGVTWDTTKYPSTPKTSYITDVRGSSFSPSGDSAYYYNGTKLLKYNTVTKKTTTIATGEISALEAFGDYLWYETNSKSIFYNTKTGTKTEAIIAGDIKAIEGDLAIFDTSTSTFTGDNYNQTYEYIASITVFNIKTQKLQSTKVLKSDGYGRLNYIGSYNKKVYFYDLFDLYCYDIDKNSFTKLKRPSDVGILDGYGSEQVFTAVRMLKKGDKYYLIWQIESYEADGNTSKTISKMRQII